MDEGKIKREAIARFPKEFGLRAWPGQKFRISYDASYFFKWHDPDSLMLYTERLCEDGEWKDFAKGTEAELRKEIVRLPEEGCEHKPNWKSAQIADCSPPAGVVDVRCSKCDIGGSVRIEDSDIYWDDWGTEETQGIDHD